MQGPVLRLRWLSLHEWGVIFTTALTLVVVIVSQTAATVSSSSDEIGVADNLNRDFLGLGVANVAAGLAGSFPVNASPPRTTLTRLAGGRTKLVGLVAALGALMLSPFASIARTVPLASLAGVLLFVAWRLIRIEELRAVLSTSGVEFVFALAAVIGVVFLNVEAGIAIAVSLALLERTWRTSRPRMVEMGRQKGTTSWGPYNEYSPKRVENVLAILFDEDLYFANAGVFRRELHRLLDKYPSTEHLIIDAVAISTIDYTGLVTLSQVVADLSDGGITVSMTRANGLVQRQLKKSTDKAIRKIRVFNSVNQATDHAVKQLRRQLESNSSAL